MMTLYSFVLFIHVTGVLVLFACLSFEALSLFRLRRAFTLDEAMLWTKPVPALPLWTAGSALVAVVSGIYLARRMSAFGQVWIDVSIAALLLIAPLAAVTGKRTRTIRQAMAAGMDHEWLGSLQGPLLKISLGVRISIFLGIVLLMVAKPERWPSIEIVAASIVIGFVSAVVLRLQRGKSVRYDRNSANARS